jgi:formylglycine-generating enzyme required for sulfatase activity
MQGGQIHTACGRVCLIESAFSGRRLSRRVLRGGSSGNQTSNVRSAYRNNNQPDNRNNNNGFRVASTLRQA